LGNTSLTPAVPSHVVIEVGSAFVGRISVGWALQSRVVAECRSLCTQMRLL